MDLDFVHWVEIKQLMRWTEVEISNGRCANEQHTIEFIERMKIDAHRPDAWDHNNVYIESLRID